MKYGGKYSLKSQLLREFDEMDVNWGYGTDASGEVTPEFIAGEKKRRKEAGYTEEETEEYLDQIKAKQAKKQNMSSQEFKEFQTSHMSAYEKKWADLGSKQAEVNTTKKVETYRDLRTVLLGMTLTEAEIDKAYEKMKAEGLKGLFWRSGFKICKFMLSEIPALGTLTRAMGLAKDIGEEALELMDLAKLNKMPPKKVRSNPLSDALALHPDYSKIIDPELEQDIFRELLDTLDMMEKDGELDQKIPGYEQSFTEFTETYLEDQIGDKATGVHGAEEAGGTGKLSDITVPKMTKEQYELFTDWIEAAGSILYNYGAEIA